MRVPPATPVVGLTGVRRATYRGRPLSAWLHVVRAWLFGAWQDEIAWLDLDSDAEAAFEEMWGRVRDTSNMHWGRRSWSREPFFTPADFAASPSFHWVATSKASIRRWI